MIFVVCLLLSALIPPAVAMYMRNYHDLFGYMSIWSFAAVWFMSFKLRHLKIQNTWYFWVVFLVVGHYSIFGPEFFGEITLVHVILVSVFSAAISAILFAFFIHRLQATNAVAEPKPKLSIAPSTPPSDITETAKRLAEKHRK
jgi:hypothetical protein